MNVLLSGSETGIKYQLYKGATPVGSPVSGTTTTLDFGKQTVAGTYTVVATNAVTTCKSNMMADATVSINPLPAVYTVSGGGSYCADGVGMKVNVSGSQSGINYQLYNAGVLTGSPLGGTGTAFDFGLQKSVGKYTVIAKDVITSCTKDMTGSATISTIPVLIPSVYNYADRGNNVCDGELVTFNIKLINGGTAPAYKWLLNGIDYSVSKDSYVLFPKNGDVVSVIMTSNAVCATPKSVSSSVTLKVDSIIIPSVVVTANTGTNVSSGQKVTFKATPTNAGTSPGYQWLKNNVDIHGATSATYVTSNFANGDSIGCTVTRQDACAMTATNNVMMTVRPLAINQVTNGNSDINVLPNPNKGEFSILGSLGTSNDLEVALEISDMLGQVVYKSKVTATGGKINERIQLRNIASGTYLLSVRSSLELKVFHIIVQ